MTLGEVIKAYCDEHKMSIRKFAQTTGMTHGYISMLINGRNPKTNVPIVPSIQAYAKIADALHISIKDLFVKIDDSPVSLQSIMESDPEPKSGTKDAAFSELFLQLSDENKNRILDLMQVFLAGQESGPSARSSD